MRHRVCVALITAMGFGSLVSAETPAELREPTETAKQKMKVLAGYIGDWRVEMTRKHPDGKTEKVIETSHYEPIYGGTWIKGTTQIVAESHSLRMTLFTGWDNIEKRYQGYSFSDQGSANQSIGTWDAESKTVTWKTSMKIPTGETIRFTHRTTFDGPDQFTNNITVVYPDGHEENVRSVAKRVKKDTERN
ncbi:MAG: DUF1579 family protein [Pirellulales bacterium]|nr:DUF1579 family protein [Pirellulales bacterium]